MEDDPNSANPPANGSEAYSQHFQHSPIAARVPDRWARGALSTGVLVLDSQHEFVLDFMQALTRPHQIVARIILVPMMFEQLIGTLEDNLSKYTQNFGLLPALPKPPPQRPSIQEIYENFKLPEDMLSGAYSNHILVGHSPSEFFFDFITGFYPTAAVSARIFMAAPQAPRMLDTLKLALTQYRKRFEKPSEG